MPKFQFWLPTKLTRIQERAVDSREPIFLTGVPGTGKTVVSIYRMKNSKANGKKPILFTYGKLLRKTIEEKLENDNAMPVHNIHKWLWGMQDDKNKQMLEDFLSDVNLPNAINYINSKGVSYDEILIDEGQDLSINTYKLLKELTQNLNISADNAQRINNKEQATNEDDILTLFPNLKKFELDEIFRSAFEIYDFAKQFVPYSGRANDTNLLERLKNKNSGADKPFVYIEPNLNGMYETIRDIIDNNPTDNIGILFENIIEVDQFAGVLSKDYELSTYHSIKKVVPSELKNIIVTTFKSAKGIEFDIVVIPYFESSSKASAEEYYVGATRAKNQLHILSIGSTPTIIKDFDTKTYKLIDKTKGAK